MANESRNNLGKMILAGLVGGFFGEGVLGALFSSPPVKSWLYDPKLQSQPFIDITPTRNLPLSVAGLIVLSVIHSWLFDVLKSAIPGRSWIEKGLFWGFVIWSMYWLFQEWFIYHTLLREPLLLNAVELVILLVGSLVEGLCIAAMLARGKTR